MSYLDIEQSIQSGRPVRLYLFERAAIWKRAYTNADRAIVFQGISYEAEAIDDDGIRLTGETSADTLKISCPADLSPAQLYRAVPPADEVWLTIRDYHFGEPDAAASGVVAWVGTISKVSWTSSARAEISCDSLSASMRVGGLRLTYERTCPHTIYDTACGVDRHLHQVDAVITSMDGASVNYSAGAAGPFSGGFIAWTTSGGLVERRYIMSESGSVLTLLGGTAGLRLGQQITIYPGCDQSQATCAGRFNNIENNGAFRHMPGKSPFDGDPVF